MPPGRPRNDAKHLHAATATLMGAVTSLVARIDAMGVEINNAKKPTGSAGAARAGKRGANAKLVSVWASYTPKQRAARIAAMRAGHARRKRKVAGGGGAKKVAPAAAKPVATKRTARKNPWASLTPEERAERVAKMRAGRQAAGVSVAST
jgi:hypothetical protein